MDRDLVARLRRAEIVYHGNFTLSSEKKSDHYVDIKESYGVPGLLRDMAGEMWDKILEDVKGGNFPTCVAGAGHGGIPLASLISEKSGLHLSMIMGKGVSKRGKVIDGYTPHEGDSVIMVDDVLTTGGTLKRMYQVIAAEGAEIFGAYAVVKRQGNISDLPFKIGYLIDERDLI